MFYPIPSHFRVWTLTLLRVATAFLFWQHGAQKLFGLLEREPRDFLTLTWFAGVLEFFGPLFIGLGLLTRWIAFVMAGEMAVAYFISHLPRGFWPILNGGELAFVYCFIYLFLATAGPGKLALDNVLFRKPVENESEEVAQGDE